MSFRNSLKPEDLSKEKSSRRKSLLFRSFNPLSKEGKKLDDDEVDKVESTKNVSIKSTSPTKEATPTLAPVVRERSISFDSNEYVGNRKNRPSSKLNLKENTAESEVKVETPKRPPPKFSLTKALTLRGLGKKNSNSELDVTADSQSNESNKRLSLRVSRRDKKLADFQEDEDHSKRSTFIGKQLTGLFGKM